jgi:8-oxo-dGTP diphosphatase
LKLKYIVLRRSNDEIRVNYIYFGMTSKREFKDTDEGKLYWINRSDLFNRKLSVMNEVALKHYLEYNDQYYQDVLVGTLNSGNGSPVINWNPVRDWEGL